MEKRHGGGDGERDPGVGNTGIRKGKSEEGKSKGKIIS
ncbi:hypothetical protein B4135_0789 [Caldibacillus debilis]|uniref:Uncharacterized protein n=1 Tax=Caldibacillus debilis TaxID=301148 RepID=A0A150M5K8_9BACI|nr:hypothetical protein B4135_0789 [Caldibacillus debilis]